MGPCPRGEMESVGIVVGRTEQWCLPTLNSLFLQQQDLFSELCAPPLQFKSVVLNLWVTISLINFYLQKYLDYDS